MLAIRMQRTGRKGHAMFRVVVQDSHRSPASGKVVARLGNYDPHTKSLTLDKEKASFYLEHGAQPSDRVVLLLKKEGVKLPKWVQQPDKQEGKIRNPDKRRSTRPDEPEAEEKPAEEAPAEEAVTEEAPSEDTPAEEPKEEAAEEKPAEEPKGEPADEASEEEKSEDQEKSE